MLGLAVSFVPYRLAEPAGPVRSSSAMVDGAIGETVRAAQSGDRTALQRALGQLAPHALRTCRRILASEAEAEEAAQETLIVLVRDLAELREPAAAVAFAVRAASRIALRIRGKRERQRDTLARFGDVVAPDSPSPAAELARRQLADRLLDRLGTLPEAQAEALVLRYVAGLEPAEIAAASGVPVNTVRSRVRLAREALARLLADDPVLDRAGVPR